mmetsp:Transcript_37133/g.82612  ORF Transcript_37133/g.82612 Transcript_37133/m.82612 type:complete len:99 (+) Transcript_37133:434-730(+)
MYAKQQSGILASDSTTMLPPSSKMCPTALMVWCVGMCWQPHEHLQLEHICVYEWGALLTAVLQLISTARHQAQPCIGGYGPSQCVEDQDKQRGKQPQP